MKTTDSARRRDEFMQRWGYWEPKRREEFYSRWADKLDCLFAKLGLTAICTHCWALVDPHECGHRDPCPECGRFEILGL